MSVTLCSSPPLTPASGFQSLDSGVVSARSSPPSGPLGACSALIGTIPLQPSKDFHTHCLILSSQRSGKQAEQSFFPSACPKGKWRLGWVLGKWSISHVSFSKSQDSLSGGIRSRVPIWGTPQPALSWVCLTGSLRDREQMIWVFSWWRLPPGQGPAGELGELTLLAYL